MKKTVRILAVVMALVMLLALAGCSAKSKIKGDWEGKFMGVDITMTFDGEKVSMEVMGQTTELGEYKFEGKKLIIDGDETKYEFKDKDTLILDMEDYGDLELKRK